MLDPYRMVFVNLISSIALLGGLLFYKFIFPKKKINLFFLLLLISVLPILSLFRNGDYESGDFNIHIYRIISFYDSLNEGIFMPSWAAGLNGTYGIPVFIFNYSLPYYFVSLFHFTGLSFVASVKMFLGTTLFFSGIFMYFWIKELTGNNLAALTASIFYLFNPYHLIDVHFRATPGESLIFALVPLIFFFITSYSRKKKFISLVSIALFTDLLFMAHPVLAIIFLGIAILYSLFLTILNKNIKPFLFISLSLISGFIASIYVWIPYIIYKPYMFNLLPGEGTAFYPFHLLFYSPWIFGFLFQGHYGELAQIIGYPQIVLLFISVILLIKDKIPKRIRAPYIFWVGLCILIIFLMHPISRIIWQFFPNFGSMMTPYGRLSLGISFCTSIIASYFVIAFSNSKKRNKIIYIILIIAIGSTILNWGHRRVIPEIGDDYLRNYAWSGIGITPYFMNPRWAESASYWFPKRPDTSLEIINGEADVKPLQRDSTKHVYIINAKTPVTIKENTLYFPGWTLKSNNKNISIYPGQKGIINAKLPQGLQYIDLSYNDLPSYRYSKIISVGFLLIFLILVILATIWQKIQFVKRG